MDKRVEKELDLLLHIMQDAMLKALEQMGDKAKELSWFCTIEEEMAS